MIKEVATVLGFVAVAMVFAIKEKPQHQLGVLGVSVERANDFLDLETAETANNRGGQQHGHGGEHSAN